MGVGTLTIYNASAGSGKTFSLAGIYLGRLFESRYSYRKILAVTFTNKATAEMKSRILDNLDNLASGKKSEYLNDLVRKTGKPEKWIREEADNILNAILHDFSRFSVSTIDSFFQKILRAFTREVGLGTGFNIEIDHSTVLSTAISETLASASENDQLRSWLGDFVKSNIDDEKGWNLKAEILKLAGELFKEDFKTLDPSEKEKIGDKDYLAGFIREMKEIIFSFENRLIAYGRAASVIYSEHGLSEDMFYQKGKGVPLFIRKLTEGDIKGPNNYVRLICDDPPKWCTGKMSPMLAAALQNGLEKTIKDAISFFDSNILYYKSAEALVSNIFSLGILSDILRKIHEITTEENTFLLSDAGEMIFRIIGNDQAPFIYEKVGNRYESYMIDEFQDTSKIQWKNFNSLILNSISEGSDNLVVGDIKQSIYRWRNSNWRILDGLLKQTDGKRILNVDLRTNWRSRRDIIRFNNSLFSVIPKQIDEEFTGYDSDSSFSGLFASVEQVDPGIKDGGYVRLKFVPGTEDSDWDEEVMKELPLLIEKLQDNGFKPSDIGIIVRDNREGALVLQSVTDYSNSCGEEKKKKYSYNIVSSDSLLLVRSYAVNFLISAFSVLCDQGDMINRAVMLRSYLLAMGKPNPEKVSLQNNDMILSAGQHFPEGFDDFFSSLLHLPLFEITERLTGFFHLGEVASNVPYLSSFQDLILNFSRNKDSDIQSFLEWWETDGRKKSVVLSDRQDSMRVLTIHKSKGLEFNAVILPFLSWSMDHKPFNQPVLWVKPSVPPFNSIGIAPVRYRNDLAGSIFAKDFFEEKYSSYLDNLNLLYVSLTRAKDVIYAFAPLDPGNNGSVASVIRKAIVGAESPENENKINLLKYFDTDTFTFEYGVIPLKEPAAPKEETIISNSYVVSDTMDSLRLKLHGENYLTDSGTLIREKVNYGKLMHEVFQEIITADDVPASVAKLVLQGKIPEGNAQSLTDKVQSLLEDPRVSVWFRPGNKVLNETGILLPSSETKRPDRVIISGGKTIVIDFKFGEESQQHKRQIDQYRILLSEMGHENIESYIWYVDKNKIIAL